MSGQTFEFTLESPAPRLDQALVQALFALDVDVSRTQVQRLLKDGSITVNGRTARASQSVEGGEQIVVNMPEPVNTDLVPENIPLDIRYEDDDLIIVNKPAGMVVHPGTGHYRGTLVNAILGYCPEIEGVGFEKRPGIVHRLDKDTSGLIVVAKNEKTLRFLQGQFQARHVEKRYLALVEGHVQPPTALIDAPIGRDPKKRKKMSIVTDPKKRARSAQTTYHTLVTYNDHTLVECELHTGRTHQIRVHMAYIGHPIVGDTVYGRRRQTIKLNRHFLHAAKLTLKRPSDRTAITVTAELPPELQQILDKLAEE